MELVANERSGHARFKTYLLTFLFLLRLGSRGLCVVFGNDTMMLLLVVLLDMVRQCCFRNMGGKGLGNWFHGDRGGVGSSSGGSQSRLLVSSGETGTGLSIKEVERS